MTWLAGWASLFLFVTSCLLRYIFVALYPSFYFSIFFMTSLVCFHHAPLSNMYTHLNMNVQRSFPWVNSPFISSWLSVHHTDIPMSKNLDVHDTWCPSQALDAPPSCGNTYGRHFFVPSCSSSHPSNIMSDCLHISSIPSSRSIKGVHCEVMLPKTYAVLLFYPIYPTCSPIWTLIHL